MREIIAGGVAIILAIAVIIGGVFGVSALYREYGVWSAEKSGEAEYAQAEQNRRIRVLEAQAQLDSAELESQAEIARARGVAEANRIVADGLGGPEGYLRYLYIQTVANTENQVIYIPTEAGLPILEAGQRP